MKKIINATSAKTERFLRYHEDPDNYRNNSANFDKMYDILSQYGTEDEDVDVVFERASREDQDRMIALITPHPKFGQEGYAQNMYYEALACDIENASADYCHGVTDAIEALFAEGWIKEDQFRTDL